MVLFVLLASLWTSSAVGPVAISMMAVGDGLADICGRRWGKGNEWSFSPGKTVAGTAAFIVGSTSFAFAITKFYAYTNTFVATPSCLLSGGGGDLELLGRIAVVSLICAAVELVSSEKIDDNYSVPIAGVIGGYLLLR